MNEIVVGNKCLRLPEPWRWREDSGGSWTATNSVISVVVYADFWADDGIQVRIESGPTDAYVPAVVLALVVLANEHEVRPTIVASQWWTSRSFEVLSRYITYVPRVEETENADQ